VCYLLVGTFTMLNLFIAVVCSAMEPEIQHNKPIVPEQRTEEPDLSSVMAELKALRSQVESLQLKS
jgi:voltage-gated sodium channel